MAGKFAVEMNADGRPGVRASGLCGNLGARRDTGQPGFGGMGGNVLAERFRANAGFSAMIDEAADRLQSELVDSGVAADILSAWETTLLDQAGHLLDAETVRSEAAAIASALGIG